MALPLFVYANPEGEWNENIPMAPNDSNGLHVTKITNIAGFKLSIHPKEYRKSSTKTEGKPF